MDRESFSDRVTATQSRLYRIACGYLRSDSDRLDAISEAILKAWQKLHTLRNEQFFDTWLTRILIRECIGIQRKQKRILPVEDAMASEMAPTENEALRFALEALPQDLRIPVILHYMEGYSTEETAKILGTTKGAICGRLFRARTQLRGLLKEEIE